LLDELERNDVSKWPPGIYGRALVREYAKSLGLPADEVVQQFVHLFSRSEQRTDLTARSARDWEGRDTADLRLTLSGQPTTARRSTQVRFAVAGAEVAAVLTIGLLVTFVSGVSAWVATAVIALAWQVARGVLCGYDELYRTVRVHRFTAASRWTQMINKRPLAARLMSIGNPRVSSTADSLVEAEVIPESANSTSIH
jgi:hypothetical protein